MIESAFPIVVTADLSRALGFWQDLLGGTVTYQFPPDGEPGYVGLDLGTSHLGIGVDPSLDASSQAGRISIWCYVTDCDAVVDRVRAAGLPVTAEPADQPWGERVAHVEDPDGNHVIVGARQAAA
jgi:lactoylglutathione lyase